MFSEAKERTATGAAGPESLSRLLAALADGRRRRIVSLLGERRTGITESELATHLASEAAGVPLRGVTEERHEATSISLEHHHLPMLESVGLVEREGATVTWADPGATRAAIVETVLDLDAPAAATETTLGLLTSERRRIVLERLRADGEATVEALATAIGDTNGARETAHISLHHRHLPKLADAGAISYDEDDERRVIYEGLPVEDERIGELLPGGGTETGRETVDGAESSEHGIRRIDGRDDIVAQGQTLFDRADDELFVMITTAGLLEPACLDRLRGAIERGVDVYVGSQTQSVRDTVRQEAPGATIWDPQRNWLDLPPTRDQLGRLVFADREAVMLGTIGVEGTEQALVGTGEDDVLVVLLRELLGERLDHLDGQSEDHLSHLPF